MNLAICLSQLAAILPLAEPPKSSGKTQFQAGQITHAQTAGQVRYFVATM
jgi:hypothetical protein